MWRSCLCGWCCSVCVLVVYVVCCRLHEVGSRAQATLYHMHGVRVMYMYKEGDETPV